jgi:hypothetical protein
MRIVISADTKHAFQEFFNGYKRKIGELKQVDFIQFQKTFAFQRPIAESSGTCGGMEML